MVGTWRIGGRGMEDWWWGHGGLVVVAWRMAGRDMEDWW